MYIFQNKFHFISPNLLVIYAVCTLNCSFNYQTYKIDSLKFQFLLTQLGIIQPILINRFVYLRKYVIENQVYKTLHQTCRSLNFHNWVGTFISSSRKRNDIKASCNRLCSNCNTFLFFVLLVHLSCLNSVDQIHIFFKGHGLIGLLATLCCSPNMVLRIH